MSVRTKLLLLSLALIVVPGAVFALLAAGDATRALEAAVGRQLTTVASDAAQDLVDDLGEVRHEVRGWASQDVMREVIVGDVDKRVSRLLVGLHEHNPAYLDVRVSDVHGRTIAAADPGALGTQVAGDTWRRALTAGDLVTAGPTRAPDERMILELATPIRDPEDPASVAGVLTASYDWGTTSALFEQTRRFLATIGLDVEILVVDAQGTLIGGSWRPGGFRVGDDLRAAGWHLATSEPDYHVEPSVDGVVGHAALGPSDPGWSVLAVQPRTAALAPVYRMNRRFLTMLGLIALGGLLVATLLADRIVRPLRALTRATSALGRGDGALPQIPVGSQDEIGELTSAFNEMAADLSRARDELVAAARLASVAEVAAGIAHEVRTPLGILRGSAQMLGRASGEDDPRRRELIAMIVDEADRIERVVAGLTQLGRPHQPAIESVPLAPLLERAAEFVENEAEAHGVAITRDFARPCVARCDPDQMYQVALNLLVNALQAQPAGGAIRLSTQPGRNERVAFEVSDDGPGIPADVRPHIFTPFFTNREGGTGLGLALVERIVRAHRGTVTVESGRDSGTTFRIELPAAVAA